MSATPGTTEKRRRRRAKRDDCVRVAVRVRPFNSRESNTEGCVEMYGSTTAIRDPSGERPEQSFAFDFSYDSMNAASGVSQEQIFGDLGRPLIDHAWSGFNCSIFAYGQTGSGKTYSMMGYGDDAGLIPRGCEELFSRIQAAAATPGNEFQVEVSYLEIYNEVIRDLLVAPRRGQKRAALQIRENPQLGVYVLGLTKILVKDYGDVQRTLDAGNRLRTVAQTKMNDTSSRSHSVFTIYFTRKEKTSLGDQTTYSKIALIDLAGSERQKHTQAQGDRLKEACAINKSLSALGNVINTLASNSSKGTTKYVPYRDSVLTRLLQESLGGNAKTVMIATISPSVSNYDESLSTLKYANRAKQIVNRAVKNEEVKAAAMESLQSEIRRLKQLLEEGDASAPGAPVSAEVEAEKERLSTELAEHQAMIEELSMSIAEKEARTAELVKLREDALADMGISLEELSGAFGVDTHTPHLVNLNADPLMSENLVYFLKPVTRIGNVNSAAELDIRLRGFGVQPEHCVIEISSTAADVQRVTLTPMTGAKVFVNGEQVLSPVVLQTGHRIIVGNNHMFRYQHPEEMEAKRRALIAQGLDPDEVAAAESPGWEFAMRELMKARGHTGDIDPDSEAGLILRLVEATDEANDIAELLRKKMIFSVELHDDQVTGARVVGIRATNLLTDSTKFWTVEKFDQRFADIQQHLDVFQQTGTWDMDPEDDPFYDPPSDQLVGVATVPLGTAVRYGELDGWFPVRFGRFKEHKGEVHVTVAIAEGALPNAMQVPAAINVRVRVGQLRRLDTEFDCGLFARFKFPEDSEQVTERSPDAETTDPLIGYDETFTLPFSPEAHQALSGTTIRFEVWGHDDLDARDPDVLQATLRAKDAELDVLRNNFALINAQQQAEIARLTARISDLEDNAYHLIRDDIEEFRSRKSKFEATLRTLYASLPGFQHQLATMLLGQQGTGGGAGGSGSAPGTPSGGNLAGASGGGLLSTPNA